MESQKSDVLTELQNLLTWSDRHRYNMNRVVKTEMMFWRREGLVPVEVYGHMPGLNIDCEFCNNCGNYLYMRSVETTAAKCLCTCETAVYLTRDGEYAPGLLEAHRWCLVEIPNRALCFEIHRKMAQKV